MKKAQEFQFLICRYTENPEVEPVGREISGTPRNIAELEEITMSDREQPLDSPQPPSPAPTRSPSPIPKGVLAGLATVILAAATGTAWWTWHSRQAQVSPPTTEEVAPLPSPSPTQTAPAAEQNLQVYWLKSQETGFELVPTLISAGELTSNQPEQQVKVALETMLKGSTASDLTSTVPPDTQLRQVAIKEDGIHVDLSQEFTFGGGSASMTGRVGQVIYTATTLDPTAPVWLSVEGQPLEVLGGEGLMIDQPMTRAAFDQNFPL